MDQIPQWLLWPGAIASALTAIVVIWKFGVVAFGRALWAAILAAPKLADGIQELGDLLRGDVLDRLEAGAQRFGQIEAELGKDREQLALHDARLDAHELALAELRTLSHTHLPRDEHGA